MPKPVRQQLPDPELTPAAETPAPSSESQPQAELIPAAPQRGQDEDFFEWMESFDSKTWENVWLYIYRLWPEISNPGEYNYLEPRYARALTRDEIAQTHGGGKYRILLNWRPWRKSFASHEFSIAGPPKFLPGQLLKDGTPATPSSQSPGNGNGSNNPAALVDAVREMLGPVLKPDVTQDKIVETLTKANEKAVELVAAAGRKQIEGAQSGDSQLSQLVMLAKALKELNPAPLPVSPLGNLQDLVAVAKLLQPEGGGFMQQIRDAFGERFVERIFSPESHGEGGWKQTAAQAGLTLIEKAPTMLDKLISLQRAAAAQPRVLNGTATPVVSEAPALPPQPRPVTAEQPAGDVSTKTQFPTEVDLTALQDAALKVVVECFEREESGEDAVLILSHVAVPVLPEMAQRMGQYPLDTIIWWLKGQPQFTPYKDHPRMEQFVGEFRDALIAWAEAQKEVPANANA